MGSTPAGRTVLTLSFSLNIAPDNYAAWLEPKTFYINKLMVTVIHLLFCAHTRSSITQPKPSQVETWLGKGK